MIYLFGDSFVENEPAESLGVEEHERWYQMLSDNLRDCLLYTSPSPRD